ncbi:MAG: DcaP family trimeric outer membrane transporter [Bacteroidota bacterium]
MLTSAAAQTEFDSLKRNSNLDTSFQPSSKPTFVTEFAEVKISGFIQPALYLDNNNVLNNDIFVTSEIPTTRLTDIKFKRFHLSANQSRLGFNFNFPKAGRKTSAYLEGDFMSSSSGQHTYFRLRHAYLTYGDFLIGQTWTNFGDVNAAPNTLDLEGPNSMPASRITQIRWRRQVSKKLNMLLAIEEPGSDYTPLDSAPSLKAAFPQFVVKPKLTIKNGHWANSLIYKPIVYTDKDYTFKKKLHTWGFTSSLSINIPDGKDRKYINIKKRTFNVFGSIGTGTQGAINDFGGLGYEAFPKDSVSLEAISYYGGYVSYSFVFRKRWSSTYVYSYLHQEKPPTTNQIFKHSHYFAADVIYAINKYFSIGTEVLYGVRKNYDNSNGNALRIESLVRLLF